MEVGTVVTSNAEQKKIVANILMCRQEIMQESGKKRGEEKPKGNITRKREAEDGIMKEVKERCV